MGASLRKPRAVACEQGEEAGVSPWCRVEGMPGQGCPPDFQALPQASLSHASGQGGLRDDPNSLTSGHLCICNDVSGSFPYGLSVGSFWILPSHSVSFFLGLLLCHVSVWCPLNLGDYVPEALGEPGDPGRVSPHVNWK